MSALSGFLGGATVGAGNAYTKLADEQREFRIDQTKQDALYARTLNLKRAEKGMEKSGVLDEAGMPMTNEQLDNYGGDRSALSGPIDQAAKLQEIKEAGQPSQYMTQDRVVLTKGELADYMKNNGSIEGLISVNLQARQDRVSDQAAAEARADKRADRSEARADKRADRSEARYYSRLDAQERKEEAGRTAALEKEERAAVRSISQGLQKTVQGRVEDTQVKWDNLELNEHPGMEKVDSLEAWKTTSRIDAAVDYLGQVPTAYKEKLLEEDPSLRDLIAVPSIVRSGKLGGMSTEEVEEELISKGYTKKQARLVTDYAKTKGYAKYSPTASRYYNGIEWISTPGYRMNKGD